MAIHRIKRRTSPVDGSYADSGVNVRSGRTRPSTRARRRVYSILCMIVALVASLVGPLAVSSAPAEAVGEPTFRNPLVSGADPTIEYADGNYYMATTTYVNRVTIRKAPTLAALATAVPATVYSDTVPGRNGTMWAPELMRLQGPNGWRWYIMYTIGATNTFAQQHLHVLESAGDDPMGPYTYRGRPVPTDEFNIDGSYLELGGQLYMMWSEVKPGSQNNYIARMSNPWTLSTAPAILSQPTEDWERVGSPVNEGPVALQRNGQTYVVYSASFCGTEDYKLGMLTYGGGDPLVAASWTKSGPVFSKANGVFGPGHNDFFTSPDGTEVWNMYHGNAGPNDGCGTGRTSRAQPVSFAASGVPAFGQPVSTTTDVAVPSGERSGRTQAVRGASMELVNRNSGLCALITGGSPADGALLQQGPCTGEASTRWTWDSTGDGFFRLVNASSGKSLDSANCGTANGTAARQWSWLANACQQWSASPSNGGYSVITNRANGRVLDAANCSTAPGSAVRQWAALGNACQDWTLRPVGDVAVTSTASGKSVDLPNCSTAVGAVLQQFDWQASPCQRWSFTAAPGGGVQIHAASAPELCLAVAGGSTSDGADVAQTTCGSPGSSWRVDPASDGAVRFVALHSGKALDLGNCRLDNGARIGQWTDLGNQCQRFRLAS